MAIEKALYQAPQGLSEIDNELEPDLEITIEDPESVEIGIDGEPILRIDDEEEEDDFGANLAEEMGDSELQSLASELISDEMMIYNPFDTSDLKNKLKYCIENNVKIRDNLNKSKEALNIFRLNDENQYYFEIYDKILDK